MKKIFLFIILITTLSCIRLKVDNLNYSRYAQISVGTEADTIQVRYINGVSVNVPLQVIVEGGLIYIPDYYNSVIKVFNINGNLVSVYGKKTENVNIASAKFYEFDINLLGTFTVSTDRSIFLQVRENTKDISLAESRKYINPSFILHISSNGSLIKEIGMNGVDSKLPFDYIESMISPREDKLYVYHNQNDEMTLSFFHKGILKQQISKQLFYEYIKSDLEKYSIILEKIVPHPEGDYYFVCFSYIEKESQKFTFKKIFQYSNGGKIRFIRQIDSINETPLIVLNTSQYYVKQIDEQNIVELQLNDPNHKPVHNLRLNLSNVNNLWRNIFINNKNEIFSTNIKSSFLEIYRWK